MGGARGRGLRPGSIVRSAGRLVLLVGLGFGAGLVIGVLSEEPTLLAGHLRGESESVGLEARARPEPTEETSEVAGGPVQARRLALLEGRPSGATEEGPAPEVAAAPRDEPERLPTAARAADAAVPGAGRWAIQVGAFSDSKSATGLATGLRSKGYPVELIPATEDSRRWRVRVQPVEGRARAEGLADRLKREERLPTWLISLEADAGS